MKRLTVILVPLVALAGPAVAANTPEALVQELTLAAHNGDERGFLAKMSADTQRAIVDAERTGSKLIEVQKDFRAAIEERFKGIRQQFIIVDRKTVLARLVNIQLIGVEQRTPSEARLRLKTITRGSAGGTATEENTISAVKEGDEWKLDLTDLTREMTQRLDKRVAAYEHLAAEVRSGAFKDSISTLLALVKAERGEDR